DKVGAAAEAPDPAALPIGVGRMGHFAWKDLLDFYTCTECGRCSDNCPAHRTGKVLSPKHLTLALRDYLYSHEEAFIAKGEDAETDDEDAKAGAPAGGVADGATKAGAKPEDPGALDLVPNVVHPDVLWACTTCR